jgi:hypothetical protein
MAPRVHGVGPWRTVVDARVARQRAHAHPAPRIAGRGNRVGGPTVCVIGGCRRVVQASGITNEV